MNLQSWKEQKIESLLSGCVIIRKLGLSISFVDHILGRFFTQKAGVTEPAVYFEAAEDARTTMPQVEF